MMVLYPSANCPRCQKLHQKHWISQSDAWLLCPMFQAADSAKLNGYLRKWKTTTMFIYSCFFVDLLQPSARLSAAFRKTDTYVAASCALTKAIL